jgi:hypothetical protein
MTGTHLSLSLCNSAHLSRLTSYVARSSFLASWYRSLRIWFYLNNEAFQWAGSDLFACINISKFLDVLKVDGKESLETVQVTDLNVCFISMYNL